MKKLLLLVLCMMSFSVVGQAEEEGKLIGYFLESDIKEKTELTVLMKQCTSKNQMIEPDKRGNDCLKEMGLNPENYYRQAVIVPVKRVREKGFFSKKIVDDYELTFRISGGYLRNYEFRPRSVEVLEEK